MKNIVLIGAPASGKGTISKILTNKCKIPHISVGNLLTAMIEKNDKTGLMIKKFMNQGVLVPDGLIIDVIMNRLKNDDCKDGYILDGFPRTVEQAKQFHKLSMNTYLKVNYVINIFVEPEILKKRFFYRQVCKKCGSSYNLIFRKPKIFDICDVCQSPLTKRNDDNEKTFNKRLKIYDDNFKKIIDFYENNNYLIVNIDGSMNTDNIIKNIEKIVD
ncbi:MAG: nucleoside monophosphate kinase [Bacilli bacterium]|nr:nucleoside monophosphate kinase [Bacilli bacterium]